MPYLPWLKTDWRMNMNQIDYENLGTRMKELRIKMKLNSGRSCQSSERNPRLHQQRGEQPYRYVSAYPDLLRKTAEYFPGFPHRQIDSEYRETALDREISEQVHKLEIPQKQKLLKTMKVWMDED